MALEQNLKKRTLWLFLPSGHRNCSILAFLLEDNLVKRSLRNAPKLHENLETWAREWVKETFSVRFGPWILLLVWKVFKKNLLDRHASLKWNFRYIWDTDTWKNNNLDILLWPSITPLKLPCVCLEFLFLQVKLMMDCGSDVAWGSSAKLPKLISVVPTLFMEFYSPKLKWIFNFFFFSVWHHPSECHGADPFRRQRTVQERVELEVTALSGSVRHDSAGSATSR